MRQYHYTLWKIWPQDLTKPWQSIDSTYAGTLEEAHEYFDLRDKYYDGDPNHAEFIITIKWQ